MARLALEQRRKPIGNTFLNVCEVEGEQEEHFKREAVQLLPGRKQRRGHSISGAYIPFAFRTLQGGPDFRRRDAGRRGGTRTRAPEHVARDLEAESAQGATGSSHPSPTGADIRSSDLSAASAYGPQTFWPDTDQESSSPSPTNLTFRGGGRAQTAPPEVLADLCARLLSMNQLSGAEGSSGAEGATEPESEPKALQTEAPPPLPALLGRETCGLGGADPSLKSAEMCGHGQPHRNSDLKSQVQHATRCSAKDNVASGARVGFIPQGAMHANASNAADQLQPQGAFRNKAGKESQVLVPGPVQQPNVQARQSVQSWPQQSTELQPAASAASPMMPVVRAAPPGFFTPMTTNATVESPFEFADPESDEPPQEVTTLMIRNLPVSISQRDLLDDLDQSGFKGLYDFLYMPSCFDTGEGKGFAFVNMTSVAAAGALVGKWHKSRRFGLVISDPSLNLSPAAIQGYEANVKKWNAPRMRRVRNPNLRPFVVEDSTKAPSTPSSCGGGRKNAQQFHSQASDVSSCGGGRKNAQRFNSQASDVSQQSGTRELECFQPAARVPCQTSGDQQSRPHSLAGQCAGLPGAPPTLGHPAPGSPHPHFCETPARGPHGATFNQVLNSSSLHPGQASAAPACELPMPRFNQLQPSGLLPAQQGVEPAAQHFNVPHLNQTLNLSTAVDSHGGQASCPTSYVQHSNVHGNNGKSELPLSSFLPGAAGAPTCSPSYKGQPGVAPGMAPFMAPGMASSMASGMASGMASCVPSGVAPGLAMCATPTLSTPPPCPPQYPPCLPPPSNPSMTSPAYGVVQNLAEVASFVSDPGLLQTPMQCSQVPDHQMQGSNLTPVRNYNVPPFSFA